MANKKKALRVSPFDEEIEASIFGGSPAGPARVTIKKAGKVAIERKGNIENEQGGNAPMQKIAMRLPQSLAVEFQQVYLQLAVWHLKTYGKKLHVQDCHFQMMRNWVDEQKRKLADKA